MKGYICAILAAVGFGAAPLLASYVFVCGTTPLILAFLRVAMMVPLFGAAVLFKKGESFCVSGKALLKITMLAATGGVLTTALLFKAYTCLDTGTATTLNFTYPVFVMLFGVLVYKDKVTRWVAISFALCVAGISLFCDPGGNFTWTGFLLALGSGVTYGVYALYMDKSHIMDEVGLYAFTFYFFLISAVIFVPLLLITGSIRFSMSGSGWLFTVLFALDGGILATLLFQIGIQKIGSQKASVLAALEPVVSVVLGVLFLNEAITVRGIVGVALVLVSTIILVVFDISKGKAR